MRPTALAAAFLALSALPALAGDPSGLWQSEKNDEGKWIDITIAPCGAQICGTITNVHGGNQKVKGIQMIKELKPDGENHWDDGQIYAPDEDTWYSSKMEMLSNTQLSVSGCVLFGTICRSQTWTRLQ